MCVLCALLHWRPCHLTGHHPPRALAPRAADEYAAQSCLQATDQQTAEPCTSHCCHTLQHLGVCHSQQSLRPPAAGVGWTEDDTVEYDLDRDDEAWLARFNGDQERMTHRRLEELLWKLDCANAEATNSVLSAASECRCLQGCKGLCRGPDLCSALPAVPTAVGAAACQSWSLCSASPTPAIAAHLYFCLAAGRPPTASSTCDCHCCTLHNFVGLTA